jgi:magnesium transporter
MFAVDDKDKAKAEQMFIYFSALLGKDIYASDGTVLGKIWDISIQLGEVYPKASELIIKKGYFKKTFAIVPWGTVEEIDGEITLNIKAADTSFAPLTKEYEFLLKRDMLDQQVVDTFNHKVRRVNDIHLLRVDHELVVAHVDIGLRGISRRLGFQNIIDAIVRLVNPKSRYLHTEELVSWKYVQPVAFNPGSMTMKLSVSQKQLLSIPAADLTDIIFDLNPNQRLALFRSLDAKIKAKIFENLEFEDQKAIARDLDKKEVAEIVGNMSPDEATDLLENLPQTMVKNLLPLIESSRAKKLSTLLGYSSDSAGGLMTTEFVSIAETLTVEQAIEYIKSQAKEIETTPYIYILDDKNHLKAVTTVRRFLIADPKENVLKTAFPKVVSVSLNKGVKEVAHVMDKYRISAVPVVDEHKVMHGVITVDDILSQVIAIAWRKRPRRTAPSI